MKKIFLIAVLAISGIINAQKNNDTKFGIRGGLNLSNFTGDYKGNNT